MSELVGEGIVRIRADETGVDVSGAGARAGQGYTKGFKSTLKGLGKAIAGAVVVDKAFDLGKFAVGSASDLNETISKTEVLFGRSADSILSWSKNANENLGATQQQALDAASSFAVFGKSAGLVGPDLTGFSKGMTALGTDLASFNNTSPEQAFTAISAALRGETEPIRQYGVLLDDASLRQEALRQGLIKTTSEALTPQQKVLATQALLIKQTTAAQGDFHRTQGGLANQGRILSAQLKDLATSFGQVLLPPVLFVARALNSVVIPAIQQVGPLFSQLSGFIKDAFASSGAGGALTGFADDIASRFLPILTRLRDMFVGDVLPAVRSFAVYVATSLWPVIEGVAKIVLTQVIPAVASLASWVVDYLLPALGLIVASFVERVKPGFDAFVRIVVTQVLPAIGRLITQIRTQLVPALQPLITRVISVIGWVVRLAGSILGKVLPILGKLWSFIFGKLVPVVVNLIGVVARVIETLFRWGGALGRAVGALGRFGGAIVGVVKGGLTALFKAVADLPGRIIGLSSKFLGAGKAIIGAFVNGLKNAGGVISGIAGNVWDALKGLLNAAIDKINRALEFEIPLPGPNITVNPPDIGHLQAGTSSWRGGETRVGEVGPETVFLPAGTRVLSAAQTRQRDAGSIDYALLAAAIVAALRDVADKARPVQFVLPSGDPEAAAQAVLNRLATA